ncbi:SMC family ATPase [Thalassotalea psychrophila]|uniref:SMC family ATPase n=1 Tax=Thalassotalea psychrophila TaxID=3065647 RepID=A0ABY9TPV3_9GAMM|nr:SMC family ATPase [Colwelliaceae bacterium SQ149]
MKLHKLSIQAFGPFAKTETIDFSELGDNPLFLIDGPTGAGKSSILHAVCYALYGETTDEDRKDMGVRSDNAADETLTELSLDFSIRDQLYRITRIPTQQRKAKRGDGYTEQKSEAHLIKILADGEEQTLVTKKVKDANEQIKLIVGLSAQQFRQVMVLPQGKFRELLLANSTERQAILSTLFQTEIFQRIEQLLKNQAGNIEREYARFKDQITEALNEVFVDGKENLIAAVTTAKSKQDELNVAKLAVDEKRQLSHNNVEAAQTLAKLFANKTQKQQSLAEHTLRKDNVEHKREQLTLAKQAGIIAPKYHALQQGQVDFKNNETQYQTALQTKQQLALNLEQASKQLELTTEKYQQRDQLVNQDITLQGYTQTLSGLEQLHQQKQQCQELEKKATDKHSELKQNFTQYTQRSEKGLKVIHDLHQELQGKAEMVRAQQTLQQQVNGLTSLLSIGQTMANQQVKIQQLEMTFNQAKQQCEQATYNANQLEMLWHSNQAAILAQTLQTDAPCPVCGSIEHPEPAVTSTEMANATKDHVDTARGEQNRLVQAQSEADKAFGAAKQELTQLELQKQKLNTELGEGFNKILEQVNQEFNTVNKQIFDLETKESKLPKWQQAQQDMQEQLAPISQNIAQLEQEIPTLQANTVAASTKLQTAEQALPEQYRNAVELETAIISNKKQIEKLDIDLRIAQQQHHKASNDSSAINATIDQISANKATLSERVEMLTSSWQQALDDSMFDNVAAFTQAILANELLEQFAQDIELFDKTLQGLQSELSVLDQQLKDKVAPNLDELNTNLIEQQNLYKQAEECWALARNQHSKLQDILTKITRIEAEQEDNKKQFEVIGTLASAASGKGNVKVSLERFVLGDLLDSVLAIASKRLHIMSKGQYRLVRQDEGTQKRNVTAGLDLAIDDAYTGKVRPVATLSGGESFMASLSLALGLSDVVQQRSGGIQLDTLFIDEGFGSLDQESLQLAIQTLIDLQATGRTIGIISHVSELKEQMALRIDVQSSRAGSSITTIGV